MRIDKNTTIKLGDRNIVKIKIGDSVIWEKKTEPEIDYFYIESLGDGNTVSLKTSLKDTSHSQYLTPTVQFSTNKQNWTTVTFDWSTTGDKNIDISTVLNTGDKMYFRNDTGKFNYVESASSHSTIKFSTTKNANAGGDIRTLANYRDVETSSMTQGMFSNLFNSNTYIVDASNLRLPFTKLTDYCYFQLFLGCTSLVNPPELPANTLASFCYQNMFCRCASLTTAPELPAMKLKAYCYRTMFSGCTSLTTAPALIANTIVNGCYERIFSNCSSLNKILVCANKGTPIGNTNDWLYYAAASGTFYNAGSITYEQNSNSGIPTGWTEVSVVHTSVYAVPDTFSAKSWQDKKICKFRLMSRNTSGIDFPIGEMGELITIGKNTGSSTVTHTETFTYDGLDYTITINQTANDVKPAYFWDVFSEGTYPFQLNSNGYYESTNKGQSISYSYATLYYEGFGNLVLECINSGELNSDYGIISQPDVQLSESTSNDGATGSTKVFKNFKGQNSTNPVQLTIPSDRGSHFITIKFIKDSGVDSYNDSLQFRVIEPTT